MKVYFRVLRYVPNLGIRLVQFFGYSVLGIVFGVVNYALVIPLLDTLFGDTKDASQAVPAYPTFEPSLDYATDLFNYHILTTVRDYGIMQALLFICIALVVSMLIASVFRYMERMAASRIKVDVVKNIRMDIFDKVSQLHVGYFNDQRKGDLISRFTNDVVEVENAAVNSLKFVLKEPITILVTFGVLFFISVKMTLFTLLVFPITGGILSEIIKRLKRRAIQSQESQGRIVNILDEAFGGMRVINAFNARWFVLGKIDAETSYHRKVNLSMARKNELASPVSETLGVMIMAGLMYFGGSMVLGENPELTPGKFLGFLALFASIIQPAKNFSNGITSVQKGTVSAERIFRVIDTQPLVKNKPDAKPIGEFKESVEFRNVSFAYERDLVLKNINLKVEKGKTIALIGPSGGGKSTLADLVPRFYDPTEGEVLLDGVSLRDYELESLRKQMGVVTQESILFNDTIFNNIAFGLEHVREEDVIQAARVANAHDFIMQTPDGYQTVIGERGSKLSGGQRQRLSIARAVLKNPPIMILDEATSALDSESERLVQDALNNLMKNRTSIVIAHRLSTIQHADEIVVIQNGQIVERGRHETLLNQSGLYKKLIEIQTMDR
ncbi:ABC transporter ATP-binding protein [Dawidia soli]|uniref:ABC transporter ATP-binding protein/permease n=1 Tax=Dawidia soli TaxID=2782352 RepID=A0AAP2DDI8_9BACT|nr:ABC transporter ATP-binding protein [Dawidia soli]MBT1688750.1 ABC transporter ATP-binding protein/permease [Dawidia soli]